MTIRPEGQPPPELISVVIPVRNGAEFLADQLEALAGQTYTGSWEVILADNGSTDDTRSIAERSAWRLPKLTIVDASQRPGASFARNFGATQANGDFLAFCDADDIVVPGWLEALATAARDYGAVTGRQDVTTINSEVVRSWRPPRQEGLPRSRFLPYASSGNLGVWTAIFRETGGFNEAYQASEDVEWSWRAQLASVTIGFAPGAVVHYRYRTSLRDLWKQSRLSGLNAVRLYHDYGSQGLQKRRVTQTLRVWVWLVARSPYLFDRVRRGIWVRRAGEAAGRVSGSVQFRVLFL